MHENDQVQQFAKFMISSTKRMHQCNLSMPDILKSFLTAAESFSV